MNSVVRVSAPRASSSSPVGPRNSFYDVFGSLEDCIAHGIALAEWRLSACLDQHDGEGGWLAEVHSAIAAFYEAVASRPLLAELFLIHSASPRAHRDRVRSLGDHRGVGRADRDDARSGRDLLARQAVGVAAAVPAPVAAETK